MTASGTRRLPQIRLAQVQHALPAVIAGIEARGYRFVTLHGFLEELGSSVLTGQSNTYTPS
jgi:hypothetical protein